MQKCIKPHIWAADPNIYDILKETRARAVAMSLIKDRDVKKIIAPGDYEIPTLVTTANPQVRVPTDGCCG